MIDTGPRYGTHTHGPARLPDESLEAYLLYIRDCPIDYSTYSGVGWTEPKQRKAKPLPERVCRYCKGQFTPSAATAIFCSPTCSDAHEPSPRPARRSRTAAPSSGRRRPTMAEQGRACVTCGRSDQPHHGRGLCETCWKRATKGITAPFRHRLALVPCPVCATPFKPAWAGHGVRQKTCSWDCSKVLRRAQPRQWSRDYAACVRCERTDARYEQHGLCNRCVRQEARAALLAAQPPAISRWSPQSDTCVDPDCHTPAAVHKCKGLCMTCYKRHSARRWRAAHPKLGHAPLLIPIPCPVCDTPFKPVLCHVGRRQAHCSPECSRIARYGRGIAS